MIYIQTYTNRKINLLNMQPQDIDIRDIAHGLSQVNRWNAQTITRYTTAEHSLYVSRLLPNQLKLYGLLHDASDAYLPDVPHALKYNKIMDDFRILESEIQDKIYQKYDIQYTPEAEKLLKYADNITAYWEYKKLFTKDIGHMDIHKEISKRVRVDIKIYQSKVIESKFLKEFKRLYHAY